MNTTFYHIYLTGNNRQDIFYKPSDFINIINRLALTVHAKQARLLAYIFHHNHFHLLVGTTDVAKFVHHFRMSITHYFRSHYQTSGSIGTRRYGKYQVRDEQDMIDLLKYILRNEVRHHIASDPLNAAWSSIHSYFSHHPHPAAQPKQSPPLMTDPKLIRQYIPTCTTLPKHYQMLWNGLILPDTFVDTSIVESLFQTKSNFIKELYTESSRERIIREKELSLLNKDKYPSGQNNPVVPSDSHLLDFCTRYLQKYLPDKNILSLSTSEKCTLAALLKKHNPRITYRQLSRILGLPQTTLWEKIGRP